MAQTATFFNSENKCMVAVDENLLSFAKELFKKANEEKAALANLASGENPPTGAAVPAYFADNSEYNNTSSKVLPQALLAAAAVGTIVFILTNKAEKAKTNRAPLTNLRRQSRRFV